MYDLPYLELAKNNEGIIRVPQKDKQTAADAICALFSDGTKLIETGDLGRKRLEELYTQDIGEQWERGFCSLYCGHPTVDDTERLFGDILADDYLAGCGIREKEIGLARKIWRYYRQFGFWCTVRRIWEKITG